MGRIFFVLLIFVILQAQAQPIKVNMNSQVELSQELLERIQRLEKNSEMSLSLIMGDMNDYLVSFTYYLTEGRSCYFDSCREINAMNAIYFLELKVWLFERMARASFLWVPKKNLSESGVVEYEANNSNFYKKLRDTRTLFQDMKAQVAEISASSEAYEKWSDGLLSTFQTQVEGYTDIVGVNATLAIKLAP